MNRRPSGSLLLSRAIPSFLQYKAAEGLSPTTLNSYEGHLKLWLEYTDDIPVKQIDAKAVQAYFVWLRTEYQSRQVAGRPRPLAPKTIRNFYITLSAFFTWAKREFDLPKPQVHDAPALPVAAIRRSS
jgi:site-specific recombinase XerD